MAKDSMTDAHPDGERIRKSGVLVYLAAWLPLAAVYAALYVAQGTTLGRAARGATATVAPMALLGIWVLRESGSLAMRDGVRGGRLLQHAWRAFLFVVAVSAISNTLYFVDLRVFDPGRPYQPIPVIIAWQSLLTALVYVAMAGISHARSSARRAEREAMRAARADSLRARADLALLRSQLNPHFVLNVLHSLLGLVRRDPALAERALEELGGLLGYGLRMSREDVDLVPLRDEWAFVEAYLDLEKLRLGDRLDLHRHCDQDASEILVPSFVLQPLVENAVVHAIAPRARGGRLEVSARVVDGGLRLEVRDDGPGLNGAEPGDPGLGLRLLRERLSALFPERDILRLEGAPGGGLVARLDLPASRSAPTPDVRS